MLRYICSLFILASLVSPQLALAQNAAVCAFGSKSLSRHLEAYQSGVRTITDCPGAVAQICVRNHCAGESLGPIVSQCLSD